jgi:hypothetical protein
MLTDVLKIYYEVYPLWLMGTWTFLHWLSCGSCLAYYLVLVLSLGSWSFIHVYKSVFNQRCKETLSDPQSSFWYSAQNILAVLVFLNSRNSELCSDSPSLHWAWKFGQKSKVGKLQGLLLVWLSSLWDHSTTLPVTQCLKIFLSWSISFHAMNGRVHIWALVSNLH